MKQLITIVLFFAFICVNAQVIKSFSEKDGLNSQTTVSITQDANGAILFSGTEGINKFDGSTWSFIKYPKNGITHQIAVWAYVDPSGITWVVNLSYGRNKLYQLNGLKLTKVKIDKTMGNAFTVDIKTDNKKDLWYTNVLALYKFNGNSFEQKALFKPSAKNDKTILDYDNKLFIDSKNNIWIPRSKGLLFFDQKNIVNLHKVNKLPIEYCTITEDSKGGIWISTAGNGVFKFDGKNWQKFTTKEGLYSDNVCYCVPDDKGNIWAAHFKGGVSVYDGNSWKSFKMGENFYAPNITSLDAVSLGGALGSGGNWSNFPSKIVIDKNGQIWYACTGGGLFVYDGSLWKQIQELSHNSSIEILKDSKGNIWFTNYGNYGNKPAEGLFKYDIEKKTWNSILKENIYILWEDKNGTIWGVGYKSNKGEIYNFK